MTQASTSHDSNRSAVKNAIEEQLERLVASPYFNQSKRLPNFLRFVVEHTLAGDDENIKERTLGIEIFGRHAGYDTAADPIVRVTAAEIRKRMAQYYENPAHKAELRISLPSGSYIPQFDVLSVGDHSGLPGADTPVVAKTENIASSEPLRARWPLVVALVAVAASVVALGSIWLWQRSHRSGFDEFWKPLIVTNDPVMLCIADQNEYSVIALRDATQPSRQVMHNDTLTAVVIDDLSATVKVAGVLQSSGKPYTLKGEGATTLDDLRRGPTVFVGAFDNAWTLRLTNGLRYHFANDGDITHLWIADSNSPGSSNWSVDRGVQMATNIYRDYAIVARFTDGDTGKVAVVAAGIGRGGTRVAGEFLTDNADLSQLMRLVHQAGDKKNFEVVLSTQIIDGEPGSPKIEATYFW